MIIEMIFSRVSKIKKKKSSQHTFPRAQNDVSVLLLLWDQQRKAGNPYL